MVWPAVIAGAAVIGSALLGQQGQKEANETNEDIAKENREFNAIEAAKSRDWQAQQRSTQYQTTVADLKAAGLNPMLAYQQGGAGTPTGATAQTSSMPQIENKMAAALTAGAQAANTMYTVSQTKKTEAETEVAHATAKQVEAQTALTTTSATNIAQQTENLKETVSQIRQNVKYQAEQTHTEAWRRTLMNSQAALADVERDLAEKKISLTEAQTRLSNITSTLSQYEIPGASNKASSDQTWWGRNVRPYLGDIGSATNSAQGAGLTIQRMRK